MNLFRLALLVIPALAIGCSSGGADSYRPGTAVEPCPGCPPGGGLSPGNPNPGPGSPAGGCAAAATVSVDNKYICQILTTFGTAWDDRDFFEEVATQRAWWSQIAPVDAVLQYKECGSGNALSFRSPREIAFGTVLYHNLKSRFGPIGVEMVLAHEWSHQVQYSQGFAQSGVPNRTIELEADSFAGFYIGWSRDPGQQMLGTLLDTIHSAGDEKYNDPGHHGTAIERKYMALWGYAQAKAALQSGTTPTWQDLHAAALRELSTMAIIRSFYAE